MIAGCVRKVGQVTAVLTGSDVTSERAPMMPQTNGLWPCSSFHGWKWSEIHSASNPAACARLDWSTSSFGVYCSQDRKYPISVIPAGYPLPAPLCTAEPRVVAVYSPIRANKSTLGAVQGR